VFHGKPIVAMGIDATPPSTRGGALRVLEMAKRCLGIQSGSHGIMASVSSIDRLSHLGSSPSRRFHER
jgi:hypothetical protein